MADKEIPLIIAKKRKNKDVNLDSKGFFVIEVDKRERKIRVEYYSNVYKKERIVSGSLEKVFIGKKSDALCDTIFEHIKDLQPDHYMYLGREIQKAEYALEKNKKYVQGGC